MNLSEFRESIQSPEPAYLIVTEQDYLKRKVLDLCQGQVEEGTRAFNWSTFDLEKDSAAELLNLARTLPWMAPRRWIHVRHAEAGKDLLRDYLEDPNPRSVLVLEFQRRPRGWPPVPVVEMPERTDPVRWAMARADREGYQMGRQTAETLVELVGENYQQLESELEKQFLWQLESRNISTDSVLEMAVQVREYDVFALIQAVARRDTAAALQVLQRLFATGMSAPQLVSMLYWNFRRVLVAREELEGGTAFRSVLSHLKIWSYRGREREIRETSRERLIQILIQLQETDRLCKSTSLDPKAHLVRLLVDTCGAKSL